MLTRYCLAQWISKLPGSFGIRWLRQCVVNFTGLVGIINTTVYKTRRGINQIWSTPNRLVGELWIVYLSNLEKNDGMILTGLHYNMEKTYHYLSVYASSVMQQLLWFCVRNCDIGMRQQKVISVVGCLLFMRCVSFSFTGLFLRWPSVDTFEALLAKLLSRLWLWHFGKMQSKAF